MATPPTFVSSYVGDNSGTWGQGTSPKTTPTFNGSLGDVLVSLLAEGGFTAADAFTFSSSPAETWTTYTLQVGQTGADALVQVGSAILSAARTGMTTISTRTGGGGAFDHVTAHFTGSDGVGNTGIYPGTTGFGTAAPAFPFTTAFDNSAIVYIVADWNAADMTTRTHRTVNGFTPTAGNGQEFVYARVVGDYTVCAAYISDAGTAGSKTIGMSVPASGTDCMMYAVEVRGAAGAPPPPDPAVLRVVRSPVRYLGR